MKSTIFLLAAFAAQTVSAGLVLPSGLRKTESDGGGQRKLNNKKHLELVGNNGKPAAKFPLALCEGDCDSDNECSGTYKCFDNNNAEYVPGCQGKRSENKWGKKNDYCYDPNAKPAPQPAPKPTAKPPPANCADYQVLPGRAGDGTLLTYAGLTYPELSQKWWESAISIQVGTGARQTVPGVYFLEPNFCEGEREYDIAFVPPGDYVMATLFAGGNIGFPEDPADYFETSYASQLQFMGIMNTSCLDDRTEIGAIGATTKALTNLDLEQTFLVDGCPLETRLEFYATGAQVWPEIGPVLEGSIGHQAGWYILLPPLEPGQHTIVLSAKASVNPTAPGGSCELQSTFNICVGTEAECRI